MSWNHLTFEYLSEVISLLAKDNVETGVNTPTVIEIYWFYVVVVQKSVHIFFQSERTKRSINFKMSLKNTSMFLYYSFFQVYVFGAPV